uniref:Uncharacterized protein n=1 Tax=Anguilla anguilla TaxID=7936 RepID=A0A0E9QD08_ANGAN
MGPMVQGTESELCQCHPTYVLDRIQYPSTILVFMYPWPYTVQVGN